VRQSTPGKGALSGELCTAPTSEKRSRLDESLLSDESESVGSKHSRFDESLVSRQSESVLSKRSRLDDSMLSKSSDSQTNDASPTTYSKSQSTWEGEHSDLDSPHK
jgi:hypothetical protein